MYLQHYRLKVKPFEINPDPKFLWLGEKHKEALASLEYGIRENKGFMLLTGDYGTGKTTIVNAMANSLKDNIIFAQISVPPKDELDFFNVAAEVLQMDKTFDTKGDFLIHFSRYLKNAYNENKKVVLVIEEVQRTGHELIEQIRLLSNIEKPSKKLITLIFVGQNEFKDTLKKNKALRQRFTIIYHIEPLTKAETEQYIMHRLSVAGSEDIIFSPGAIDGIYTFSEGIPRLINTICDLSLLTGYSNGEIIIDSEIIRECAENFRLLDQSGTNEIEFKKNKRNATNKNRNIAARSNPAARKKAVLTSVAVIILAIVIGYFLVDGENNPSFTDIQNFLKNEIAHFTDWNPSAAIQKPDNILMNQGGSEKSVENKVVPGNTKAVGFKQPDKVQSPKKELNRALTELKTTKAKVTNLEKVALERKQLLIQNEEKLIKLTKELEQEKKNKDILQAELSSKAVAVSDLQGKIESLKSDVIRYEDEIKNSKKVIQTLQGQLVDEEIPKTSQVSAPVIVEMPEVKPEKGAGDQAETETPDPADIIDWVIKKKSE